MIEFKDEYRAFIVQQGVGLHDSVASSPDSYLSYLNSVSDILQQDISPAILRTEDDINRIVSSLKGHRAPNTIANYRSAMRQYVNFVASQRRSYDVAERLRTPEEMAAHLDARLQEASEGVSGVTRALADIVRAKGMNQLAQDAGLSRESVYHALTEGGDPSLATVLKVARALGLRLRAQPI